MEMRQTLRRHAEALLGRLERMNGLQDISDGEGELRVEEDDWDRNEARAAIWLPEKEREWVRYWRGFRYEACIEKGR
jgi:hypothetical protein